jgi:hypothetical protein
MLNQYHIGLGVSAQMLSFWDFLDFGINIDISHGKPQPINHSVSLWQ